MKWMIEDGSRGRGTWVQGGNFQGDNPELDVGERIYLREADLCSFNMLIALFTNSTSTCRLAGEGRESVRQQSGKIEWVTF